MVAQDAAGRIVGFVDKPAQTELTMMWGMAAWSPRFADFLADNLAGRPADGPELVLSDVFAAALAAGLDIQGAAMPGAHYHDIGTPEDFQSVVLSLALGRSPAADSGR
jgi:NDP-sugar pyrophosphorylase family protein